MLCSRCQNAIATVHLTVMGLSTEPKKVDLCQACANVSGTGIPDLLTAEALHAIVGPEDKIQSPTVNDLPKELLDEVHDIAASIVNAVMAEDDPVAESARSRLRELYKTKMHKGEGHPFLTETLADFTLDNVESIRLYKEAIRQCANFPNEPIHTKMFSLAETLVEMKRLEEAEAYLVAARQHALKSADADALKQIAELLKKVTDG